MEAELCATTAAPSICTCDRDVHEHTTFSSSQACGLSTRGKNNASGTLSPSSALHHMCGERRGCCCEPHCTCAHFDASMGNDQFFNGLENRSRCKADETPLHHECSPVLLYPPQRSSSVEFSSSAVSCKARGDARRAFFGRQEKKGGSTAGINEPSFSVVRHTNSSISKTPWKSGGTVGGGGVESRDACEPSLRQRQLQRELEMKKHEYTLSSFRSEHSCPSASSAPARIRNDDVGCQPKRKEDFTTSCLYSQVNGAKQSRCPSLSLMKGNAGRHIGKVERDESGKGRGKCSEGGVCLPSQRNGVYPPSITPPPCDCFDGTRWCSSQNTTAREGKVEGEKCGGQKCLTKVEGNEEGRRYFHPCLERATLDVEHNDSPSGGEMQQGRPATQPSELYLSLPDGNFRGATCPRCGDVKTTSFEVECCSPHFKEQLGFTALYLCCTCGLIWGPALDSPIGEANYPSTSSVAHHPPCHHGVGNRTSRTTSSALKPSSLWYGRKVLVSDISYLQRRAAMIRNWEKQGKIINVSHNQQKKMDPNKPVFLNSFHGLGKLSDVALSKWKIV